MSPRVGIAVRSALGNQPGTYRAGVKQSRLANTRVRIAILFLTLSSSTAVSQVPPATAPPAARSVSLTDIRLKQNADAEAVKDCEQMWDRDTHMTKKEWSTTCRRVQNRLRNLEVK